MTITNIVCICFALVLVALRIYTRLAIVRKRFWEDMAIVAAMVCNCGDDVQLRSADGLPYLI